MFKRKLTALEHVNPDSVNIEDENNFQQLIIWLEDQKIRHYKIEERMSLKQTDSPNWNKAYLMYLSCLDCPVNPLDRASAIDWLLGLAVQLEYSDSVEKFNKETAENVRNKRNEAPKVVNTNPLDALDFQSIDFKDGINSLATLLKIKTHPDHLVTLKAISYLLTTRLSQEALKRPEEIIPKGKAYPIEEIDPGFETGDPALNDAGKKLRLLYIHDIRTLFVCNHHSYYAIDGVKKLYTEVATPPKIATPNKCLFGPIDSFLNPAHIIENAKRCTGPNDFPLPIILSKIVRSFLTSIF